MMLSKILLQNPIFVLIVPKLMEALIKVLFIMTSHSEMGHTGLKTGWFLKEVAYPYDVFTKASFQVDFMSPKGGLAPMDPGSGVECQDDPVCQKFVSSGAIDRLNTTMTPSHVNISEYQVIFYPGGHGPMFDLPNNDDIAQLTLAAYESGAIVSAVCHGTVGFVPVRHSNGLSLVQGQTITSFTNAEEAAGNFYNVVPFLLETKLRMLGAHFVSGPNFKPNVQTSGRLVTGQNPQSAKPLAEQVVRLVRHHFPSHQGSN
ncbi:uncharacterized protein LOC144617645 [Crassostrea virginica]